MRSAPEQAVGEGILTPEEIERFEEP